MKVLRLELNNKTYTTGKITAFMAKEALKLQRDALEFAKKGVHIKEDDYELMNQIMQDIADINDRKAWLICEVYGKEFTVDELEKALSNEEINEQINAILYGITGVIQKN